jgi:hypothetical protein
MLKLIGSTCHKRGHCEVIRAARAKPRTKLGVVTLDDEVRSRTQCVQSELNDIIVI